MPVVTGWQNYNGQINGRFIMTKKTKVLKGLTLADFMTNTNLSKPSEMQLTSGGVETDHHLMIIGAQAKQVTRARMLWGRDTAELDEKLETIKDDIEKAIYKLEHEEAINNDFALELVIGWSFGAFNKKKLKALLEDNARLSYAIITQSFGREATLEKK